MSLASSETFSNMSSPSSETFSSMSFASSETFCQAQSQSISIQSRIGTELALISISPTLHPPHPEKYHSRLLNCTDQNKSNTRLVLPYYFLVGGIFPPPHVNPYKTTKFVSNSNFFSLPNTFFDPKFFFLYPILFLTQKFFFSTQYFF